MSVSSTTRKQQFVLDGVEDEYTFTFRALTSAPEDIKCKVTTAGTTTALTYTTDYTVAINSDGIGGTVTLVDPAAVGLGTLMVYRETTNTQESDYDDYNQFPANTLEEDIDKRTMLEQELSENLERCPKLPIESMVTDIDFPEPAASKGIKWNTAATALINTTYNADEEAIAAATSSAAALASQIAAATSAATALASQIAAATSATSALSYSNIAVTNSTLAGLYATTASTQAIAAATSATTALSHSTTALTASTSALASEVAAATSATTASNYATTASTQAIAAATSATTAASHATTALTARDQAEAYAESAAGIPIATAGGTADAITADYTPNITLSNLSLCAFVATTSNATTTPTFNPDGLGAKTITKKGGAALVAGDIPGALAVCILEYNLANTRWELLNPAKAEYTDFSIALKERIVKGWINFNGTGTIAISDSYNVTSITDNGTGDYTVTWDVDFANANYAITSNAGTSTFFAGIFTIAAGSVRIKTYNSVGDLTDVTPISAIAIGDQ